MNCGNFFYGSAAQANLRVLALSSFHIGSHQDYLDFGVEGGS